MDILLEVLKWVIIVLLAGFIGQFGKSISLHIINYFKKRKAKKKAEEAKQKKRNASVFLLRRLKTFNSS